MITTKIVFSEFGPPLNVLRFEVADLPAPGPGEVVIRTEFAPINPADLNFIEGKYGIRPELPAVAGLEAGAVIESLGPAVDGPAPGTRVLPPMTEGGAWVTRRLVKMTDLVPLPQEITAKQAATLRVNPGTALRLLEDFVALKPGDWVAQNAANSAVGRHVIQIAKHRGLKTINLVRRSELIQPLKAEGGDIVLLDDEEAKEKAKAESCGAKIKLGLNCVGGESATRLAGLLAPGGTMVTYGAMSRKALVVPNGLLIFKDITFAGFWLTRWLKQSTPESRRAMFNELAALAIGGVIKTPIHAVYPADDVVEAVMRATESGRSGKVLLDFSNGMGRVESAKISIA